MPLITPHLQEQIYRCFHAECTRMRIELLAVGGMDDHVHLLVRLPSTVSIADAVKQLKGSSSHFANHEVEKTAGFRWQGSYGAFSVSERILPRVRQYIANQEQHHRTGALHRAYELG